MGTIQPIETFYNGHHFRSRLEARWAVALDMAKVPFVYEIDTYPLAPPKRKPGADLGDRAPFANTTLYYLPDFWLPMSEQFLEVKGVEPTPVEREKAWRLARDQEHDVLIAYGELPYPYPSLGSPRHESALLNGGTDDSFWLCECTNCGKVGFQFQGRIDRLCTCPPEKKGGPRTPRLMRAYLVGRQARFEYGESGGPRLVPAPRSVPVARPVPADPKQSELYRAVEKAIRTPCHEPMKPLSILAPQGDLGGVIVHLQAANGLPWCVRNARLQGNSYGGFIVLYGSRIPRDYRVMRSKQQNPAPPKNLCGRCVHGWPGQPPAPVKAPAPAPVVEEDEDEEDEAMRVTEAIWLNFPNVDPVAVHEAAERYFGRELTVEDLENAEECAWCGKPMFDNDYARLGDNEADPDMQHVCMDCIAGD